MKEITLPNFHTIFTTNYYVAFKIFGKQNSYFKGGLKAFSNLGSFHMLLYQSAASVISKWGRGSYFKGGECLFQSGPFISKWGKSYFKVEQNVISKGDNYFKMKYNTAILWPRKIKDIVNIWKEWYTERWQWHVTYSSGHI